jgi:hypothetical protein
MRKLTAIIVAVLALAACAKTAPPITAGELAQQKQHNACMRSAGVDVPDPEEMADGGGDFTLNTEDPKTLAALSACARLDPGGHREGDPDPAVEERTLALAECLRKHGIRAKDPEPDGPPVVLLEDGAKYSQQQLVDAYTACGKEVPR